MKIIDSRERERRLLKGDKEGINPIALLYFAPGIIDVNNKTRKIATAITPTIGIAFLAVFFVLALCNLHKQKHRIGFAYTVRLILY